MIIKNFEKKGTAFYEWINMVVKIKISFVIFLKYFNKI